MMPSSDKLDPDGYYACLGVDVTATREQIAAAFRAQARVLHPDVAQTGNAEAFMRLKQAYDVLSDTEQRGDYDRRAAMLANAAPIREQPHPYSDFGANFSAERGWSPHSTPDPDLPEDFDPTEDFVSAGDFGAEPDVDPVYDLALDPQLESLEEAPAASPAARPVWRWGPLRLPHLADLPVAVWLGMAVLLGGGVIEAVVHFWTSAKPQPQVSLIRPNAPSVTPLSPTAQRAELYGAPPVHLPGTANFYVGAAGPAVLWQPNPGSGKPVPMRSLPPFSTVQVTRVPPNSRMLEVLVRPGSTGLMEAARLVPGDTLAARRAYCGNNAGTAPLSGDVLAQHMTGDASLHVENRLLQPAVVKLRDPTGRLALSVYLDAGSQADLTGLAAGPYRPEFAVGGLWSRACDGFATGMHAARADQVLQVKAGATLVVAPAGELPDTPLRPLVPTSPDAAQPDEPQSATQPGDGQPTHDGGVTSSGDKPPETRPDGSEAKPARDSGPPADASAEDQAAADRPGGGLLPPGAPPARDASSAQDGHSTPPGQGAAIAMAPAAAPQPKSPSDVADWHDIPDAEFERDQ